MKFKLNKLKYIDLFGRRTELSMNGQKSHKTWCGTFCTIMIFAICALSSIYYITQFFRRANPQYIYSEVYDSLYEVQQEKNTISPFSNLKIGSNGFFAMMGLENKDYNINEYNIQFTVLSQGKIVSEYKGIKCSEVDYFQDLLQDPSISDSKNFQLVKENPQNFVCLGNTQETSLFFVYEAQSTMFIQLSCSDSQNCKNISGQRVFIISSDYLIVLQDFAEPLDLYVMSNYVDLDINYTTIVDVQLQKVLIQTDIGYLATEYEYKQQVTFKDFKRYNSIRNPSSFSSPLLVIEIQPFSKRQIYQRSYPKFLSVLSIIGGLMKTLLVIGYFCTKPFSKISMRSELVNQLFTFEKISSKKLKKIHEIKGQSEENFNMDEDKNQKLPRSKTMTLTYRKQESNQQKNEQMQRSFENLKDGQIKYQMQINEQQSTLRHTPYSHYLESNLNAETPRSNLISTARQFNGQQQHFFAYPVSHFPLETQSIEVFDNFQTDLRQNIKIQNNDDAIRFSPIQKQYSNNSDILSEDQFNSVNQNHVYNPQIFNSMDIGQKYQLKLFNKNSSCQKESQFTSLNDNFIQKTNNYLKENKVNELENGNLKTFQTQYSQDLTTQEPLTIQHNPLLMNHLDLETIKDKNSVTQSTKSTLKRLNQSRQLKHSLSQYDDNKGNQVDLQKQLEQKNLMQRRNANFDRDKKAFVKKDTHRGSQFSIQDQQAQNQDQEKDSKKQASIKLTKNNVLQKKESIKPSNGQQSQADGEQKQNGSASRRIKSFFSSKTKEITDLIRFNINQRQQHNNKEEEAQKNNENQSNNQQSQSQSVDEKKKKHSNLIKQKTNKKFEGILNEKQEEKSMVLNIIDYVKYFFACFKDTSKVKQMKYTNKKVKKRLDIIYILEKLIEIDKLKVLLLNPDQINLFDYMPKEFVQFNSMENKDIYDKDNKFATWSLLCAEKTALDKYSNACIAYHHIQQNSNKTKIDKKLIQMLDPQVKRYFNKMIIQPEELNQYRTLLADYSLSQEEKISEANQNINQLYLHQQNDLQNIDYQQQNIFNSPIQHNLFNSNQPYFSQLQRAQSQNFNQMSNNIQSQGINQFQIHEKSRNPYVNNEIMNSQRLVDKSNYSSYIPHEQQSTFSIQEKQKAERNQLNLNQNNKSLSPKSFKYDPSKLSPDQQKNKQSSPYLQSTKTKKNNKKFTIKYQCQAPIIEESNIFISSEQFGGSQKHPKDPCSPVQFPNLEEKKSHLFIKRTQSISAANLENQIEERNNKDFDEQKSQIYTSKLSIPKILPVDATKEENNEEIIKFENTELSLDQSEKLTTSPSSQMKDKNFKANSNIQ
ncbi:hypothetical protein ABPG74_005585 [Tetrahymena malaccensis]